VTACFSNRPRNSDCWPKRRRRVRGLGGFVGRNWQLDDLVFGVEANYNYFDRLTTSTSASNALEIVSPAGTPGVTSTYGVTLTGRAAAQVKDAITFRGARVGQPAISCLMYSAVVAVGRMDVSRSVTSNVTRRDDTTTTDIFGNTVTTQGPTLPVPAQSQTLIEQRTNAFVAGWTAVSVWNTCCGAICLCGANGNT